MGAIAGGVLFQLEGNKALSRAENAVFTQDREQANQDILQSQIGMGALYGVGGAALAGAVLSFVYDRSEEVEVYRPPFSVDVGPSGVLIQGTLP